MGGGASTAVLRAQTNAITSAINRQIQRAMRPKLQIRNGAGAISALELGSEGRFLAIATGNGGVRLWDLENGRQTQQITPVDSVSALDIGTGTIALAPPPQDNKKKSRAALVPTSTSQRLLALASDSGGITLYDAVAGTVLKSLGGHTGAVLAVRFSRDLALLASAGADGTVRLWEVASGRQTALLSGHSGAVSALAFSPSGRWLASGGTDGTVRLWQVPEGTAVATLGSGRAVRAAAFGSTDSALFSGGDDGTVHAWAPPATAEKTSWETAGRIGSLSVDATGHVVTAGSGARIEVWSASGGEIATIKDSGNTIANAALVPGGAAVIGAGQDGRAKVWSTSDGSYRAQLILTRGGWSVTDANGRFDGTAGGLGDVAWVGEGQEFEITNFADPYYEPGLLAKTLRAPGALLTAAAPAVDEGVGVPPTVSLSSSVGTSAGQPGPAQITVVASDQGGGLDQVTLYHNDKALPASQVVSDSSGTSDGRPSRTVVYTVTLAGGLNRLRAEAFSAQRIQGQPAQLSVSVQTPAPRPTLQVLVVGINRYAEPQLTLNYAVADAKGFIDWARRQGGGEFGAVQVTTLLDQQATRAAIVSQFERLRASKPEDVVVIYLAGHGETARDNWYFLPTEFGHTLTLEAVAAEGVSSQTIEQAVVNMGAQRVLLLIDSCKSGSLKRAFAGDADRKELQSLSRDAGIHVLAATDKGQLAVELEELGHGAFTYTVLDALNGKAGGPTVRAKAVLGYAEKQVPVIAYKYTSMEQFPTVFSRGSDFEIGRARGR